jgi:hypothetical protein
LDVIGVEVLMAGDNKEEGIAWGRRSSRRRFCKLQMPVPAARR